MELPIEPLRTFCAQCGQVNDVAQFAYTNALTGEHFALRKCSACGYIWRLTSSEIERQQIDQPTKSNAR